MNCKDHKELLSKGSGERCSQQHSPACSPQQDLCPLRNTPSQLSHLLVSSRKNNLSFPEQPPSSITTSNFSCANASLPFLPGMGLQVHSIPSFNLMPRLAWGAVKDLLYCRVLTVLSFLSNFCYHDPTVLVSQLLASSDILISFLKRKTHVFWNGDENSGCSCIMLRMSLKPQWGGKDPLAPFDHLHGGFASLQYWGNAAHWQGLFFPEPEIPLALMGRNSKGRAVGLCLSYWGYPMVNGPYLLHYINR